MPGLREDPSDDDREEAVKLADVRVGMRVKVKSGLFRGHEGAVRRIYKLWNFLLRY